MLKEFLNSPFLLIGLVIFPLVFGFLRKRKMFLRVFLPTTTITVFLGSFLKKLTAIPRPFFENPQVLGVTSNIPADYSFPSLHATAATLLAWMMTAIAPSFAWIGFAIAFLISISRVYLGVHYFRDIVVGFTLATSIYWFIFLIAKDKKTLVWGTDPNLRRKLIHLFYGLILVTLIEYNILNIYSLAFIILLFAIFVSIPSGRHLPFLKKIIVYFERDPEPKYLAFGPFLFTLSSFLSLLVFRKNIAIAAILNLAIGDSVNALIGHFLKKDKGKRIEASFAAFLATALVATQYVALPQAIFGGLITLILEYSEPKFRGKKIDDNLLIPIASGVVMTIL